jgi:hypothetical protein
MKITNNVQIDKTIRSLANTIEKTAKHKYLIDLSESLTIHLTAFVLGEYKKQGLVSLSLEKYIVQNKKNISFGTYKVILESTAKFLADINSPSIISHLLLKESKELIHLDRFKKAFTRYKTLIEKGDEVDFNKEIKNAISNQGAICMIEFLGCIVTLRNRYSHPHYELKNGQMVQWPTTDSTYYDILNPILEDALNETIQKLNNVWEFRQYLVENNEGGILTLREPHNQIDNIVEVKGNYPEGVLVFANENNDVLLSDWKILTKPSEEALEGIRKEEEELRNKATIEDLKISIKSALNDKQISLDELNFFESLGKTKLGISKEEIKKIILEVANSMGIEDPFPEVDKRFIELIDNAIDTKTYNEFLLKLTGQQYGVDNETFEKVFNERTFALNVDPDEIRRNKVIQFSTEELIVFQGLMSSHKWLMGMSALRKHTKESIYKIKEDSYVFGTKEYWHRTAFNDLEKFVKVRLKKLAIDDEISWDTNQNNWQIGAMTSYAWCTVFPKNLATKKILALHISLYSDGSAAIGYLPDWKDYKGLENYGLLLSIYVNHLKAFANEYETDLKKYPNLVVWDGLNNNRHYSFTDSIKKFPWFYDHIYGFDQIQFVYNAQEIVSNPSILIEGFDISFNLFNGLFEGVNRDYLNMLNADFLINQKEKEIRMCLTDLEPIFVNFGLCEAIEEEEIEIKNDDEDGAQEEIVSTEKQSTSDGLSGSAYLGYFSREFKSTVKSYPLSISFQIKQDHLNNKLNYLIYVSCAGYLQPEIHLSVERVLESMQDLQFENTQFLFKRSKLLVLTPIDEIDSFSAVPLTNFFLEVFSTRCARALTPFLGLKLHAPIIDLLEPKMVSSLEGVRNTISELFRNDIKVERNWKKNCRYVDYVYGSKSVPCWIGWGFEWRDSELLAGLVFHVRDSIKGSVLMEQMKSLASMKSGWDFQIVGEAENVEPEWILQENHTFKLSASTEHSKPHTAAHALMSNRKTYWAAKIKNEEQWWQLESKEPLIFSKLKFTGSPIGNSYMQLFNIGYSMDGSNWDTIEAIEGIDNGFDEKEIIFSKNITARFIRVFPTKYVGWPGFRIDFLAKKMLPNKIELQWLLPVSNANDIENVMSQLTERIMVIKNMEGSSI